MAAGAPHADCCEIAGLAHEIGEVEAGETVAGWLLLRDCCGNPVAAPTAPKKQPSQGSEAEREVALSVDPEAATLDQVHYMCTTPCAQCMCMCMYGRGGTKLYLRRLHAHVPVECVCLQ